MKEGSGMKSQVGNRDSSVGRSRVGLQESTVVTQALLVLQDAATENQALQVGRGAGRLSQLRLDLRHERLQIRQALSVAVPDWQVCWLSGRPGSDAQCCRVSRRALMQYVFPPSAQIGVGVQKLP